MPGLESLRNRVPNSGQLNQRRLRFVAEAQRRGAYYTKGKEHKAEQRKDAQEEFIQYLPEMQFGRAVLHVFDGTATLQDINYLFKHPECAQAVARVIIKPKTT